jgi:hypothetical protein
VTDPSDNKDENDLTQVVLDQLNATPSPEAPKNQEKQPDRKTEKKR